MTCILYLGEMFSPEIYQIISAMVIYITSFQYLGWYEKTSIAMHGQCIAT